ncbi:Uncharacterized protein BM_BM7838 [Brugia malayi]|uniref:Bm7838 n=2 Tax=Brugia TaxID=6278 RepID=A0A0H5S0Q2_BRUMA|nr:Uncharacterized protein BM_BM7838 [Brugia malayi]CRZ21802.1 Bm7838 [Brugia malayi]VDO45455.1 unnamed protein product [Brugia timori]VIO89587.1 Uncharacterized protein BM_BM7838 [Brugia malayi]
MSSCEVRRSPRMRVGPLNSSTPKMKLSRTKSENQLQNLKNISFESNHTEPPSTLSPLGFSPSFVDCEQKMAQTSAKKGTISQTIPLVKKKDFSRRNSRSRSRGRKLRRSKPSTSLTSQIVKTDSVEKLLPNNVRHSIITSANSAALKNHSSETSAKSSGTISGAGNFMKLSSHLVDHPYILTFIHLLLCVLYAFIIYKAANYFGVDRFVIKHWTQWSKKILPNLSS